MNFDPSQSSSDSAGTPASPDKFLANIHPFHNTNVTMLDHVDAKYEQTNGRNDSENNNCIDEKSVNEPSVSDAVGEAIAQPLVFDTDSSDMLVIEQIHDRPRAEWYRWFTVIEHVTLVVGVCVVCGLGYLASRNSNK